ncbi:DNA-processing protein DprA [Paenibacillus sp. YYML68]|uniref:DNA-processing protein DprA n=1 Tax=Paenibacillus sp. YYML68 TaxID=2909250 RepID=UPI0024905F02|nr:DNA-processing protein DprA [Paenibacillus sp. YYML68]
MDNRHVLFGLHQLPGIGWKTLRLITERFEQLDHIRTLEAADWQQLGFTPVRAAQLHQTIAAHENISESWLEQQLARYEQHGIQWVTVWDDDYPSMLKETADPPWLLYMKGDKSRLHTLSVGVVGTRTPTVYGKTTAERLSEELAASGICVVSGLARGIDSQAHIGALRGRGSTIAVLGHGLDHVYPAENKQLFLRIASSGLLLTEYPLGTKPVAGLFPQRNRIIAGLSEGVMVVEAAVRSGSLITAELALDYSRDVFAIPGPINSPKSQGVLQLLKSGAKLVTSASDIMEEYAGRLDMEPSTHMPYTNEPNTALTKDERRICDLLANGPLTIDQLLMHTQFSFGHLHAVLINLLMMRRIVELPGSAYTIT